MNSIRRPDGSVGMALVLPAGRLPMVVRIPAGPLGSLKCDPPKGNGRRPQKKKIRDEFNWLFRDPPVNFVQPSRQCAAEVVACEKLFRLHASRVHLACF